MQLEALRKKAADFLSGSPDNRISEEDAVRSELTGMQIYDSPLLGVSAAEDPLFRQLRQPEVLGADALLPTDWLPDAQSVLSFFLPFTQTIRQSNRPHSDTASDEWLHARIEGQLMLDKFGAFLCQQLEKEGFSAVYAAADPRFHMTSPISSNWSERHVAYISGLGTFGLSKGLITEKGMAGRFGSVITSAPLPVTQRAYSSPFEYCTMCGKCQKNCPVQAIDITRGVIHGKDQNICAAFIDASKLPPHGPHQRVRYGCGKCQVDVPCESGIPGRG